MDAEVNKGFLMRVCIVGAGICGSYLAWRLKQAYPEVDIKVFEQKKRLGKPCSGLVSERIWEFIPENKKLVKNRIKKVKVHYPKKTVSLWFEPEMLVFDRPQLDKYVSSLALKEGVKINFGEKVERVFLLKKYKPQVKAEKLEEFDYLIGCDGANSVVRTSLSKNSKNRLGILAYGKGVKKYAEVFPTKNGFAWAIPHNSRQNIVEYGVVENISRASEVFKRFWGKKRLRRLRSAIIPNSLVFAEHPRVALCGDAAGLTKPWSGGGIIWGLTAAEILVKTFPNFKKYEKQIRKKFGPVIFVSRLAVLAAGLAGKHLPLLLKDRKIDSDWLF